MTDAPWYDPQGGTKLAIDAAIAAAGVGGVDVTAVHQSGAEAVAGVKTFSSAPVLPAASLPESAVIGLVADLAAKAADSAVVKVTGTQTVAGAKTLSSDLTFSTNAIGPVIHDASDGHTYRIISTAGVLSAVLVT